MHQYRALIVVKILTAAVLFTPPVFGGFLTGFPGMPQLFERRQATADNKTIVIKIGRKNDEVVIKSDSPKKERLLYSGQMTALFDDYEKNSSLAEQGKLPGRIPRIEVDLDSSTTPKLHFLADGKYYFFAGNSFDTDELRSIPASTIDFSNLKKVKIFPAYDFENEKYLLMSFETKNGGQTLVFRESDKSFVSAGKFFIEAEQAPRLRHGMLLGESGASFGIDLNRFETVKNSEGSLLASANDIRKVMEKTYDIHIPYHTKKNWRYHIRLSKDGIDEIFKGYGVNEHLVFSGKIKTLDVPYKEIITEGISPSHIAYRDGPLLFTTDTKIYFDSGFELVSFLKPPGDILSWNRIRLAKRTDEASTEFLITYRTKNGEETLLVKDDFTVKLGNYFIHKITPSNSTTFSLFKVQISGGLEKEIDLDPFRRIMLDDVRASKVLLSKPLEDMATHAIEKARASYNPVSRSPVDFGEEFSTESSVANNEFMKKLMNGNKHRTIFNCHTKK